MGTQIYRYTQSPCVGVCIYILIHTQYLCNSVCVCVCIESVLDAIHDLSQLTWFFRQSLGYQGGIDTLGYFQQ